jgi:hypothetical protein
VRRAPGFPCALFPFEGTMFMHQLGRTPRREKVHSHLLFEN